MKCHNCKKDYDKELGMCPYCVTVPNDESTVKIEAEESTYVVDALTEDRNSTKTSETMNETKQEKTKRREQKIEKDASSKWPVWAKAVLGALITGIVVLLVLIATGVVGKKNKEEAEETGTTRVPFVINMNKSDAKHDINEAQLISQIIDKQNSLDIKKDLVLKQSVSGGKIVEVNDTIGLIISGGERLQLVPDEFGYDIEVAEKELSEAGFTVTKREENSAVALGRVLEETYAGEVVAYGSEITITVSKGLKDYDPEKDTTVPKLEGLNTAEALESLTDARLTMSKIEGKYSDTIPKGVIIEQKTAEGTEIKEGENIEVIISEGERLIYVSDVQYKSKEEAVKTLEKTGLIVNSETVENLDVLKGRVVEQSIAPWEIVAYGSEITIYVSEGNPDAATERALFDELVEQEKTDGIEESTETERTEIITQTTEEIIVETAIETVTETTTEIVETTEEMIYGFNVNDIVEFGGKAEKVKWIVLAVDDENNSLKLLSKDIIGEEREFEDGDGEAFESFGMSDGWTDYVINNVKWETSSIRRYLNRDFIQDLFESEEEKHIIEKNIETQDWNGSWYTTTDRVQLMSVDEAEALDDQVLDCKHSYWLRSTGLGDSDWMTTATAAFVYSSGYDDFGYYNLGISDVFGEHFSSTVNGVRPVIWVDMSAVTAVD